LARDSCHSLERELILLEPELRSLRRLSASL
jgi:hypothetical protein